MPDVFVSEKARIKKVVEKIEEKILDPRKVTLFSTFVENPSNISFHHQAQGEKIFLFLRSHFLTNFKWLLISAIFALFPLLVLFAAVNNIFFFELPENYILFLLSVYYMLLFAYIFSNFLSWYFNIFLITQKRVIDIDFSGLVFHDVAETQFSLLQDVNYNKTGILRHLFDFGDVFAQTAGGKENLEALGVPKPSKVTTFITKYMGRKNGAI